MTIAPADRPGRRRIVFAAVVILAAALDLWSKSAAFERIGPPARGHFYIVFPKLLRFETAMNPGIAWSLLSQENARWFIAGLSIVALPVIVAFFLRTKSPSWLFTLALAFIAGGTIGNLHDRLKFAAVRDFIRVLFIDFPVFNVADSFICVGAVLVVLEALFAPKPCVSAPAAKTPGAKKG